MPDDWRIDTELGESVWCAKCNADVVPVIYRARAMSVTRELCPKCDNDLEDIVPSYKDRIAAARIGDSGLWPGEGKKLVVSGRHAKHL